LNYYIEIKSCKSFTELLNLIESIIGNISGIGELYLYDTSLRIGAKLELFPKVVYLHRGTRIGAKKLAEAKKLGYDLKQKFLSCDKFPKELQELKPLEIEGFLCIYRNQFNA